MVYIRFSVQYRLSREQYGTMYISDLVWNVVYLETVWYHLYIGFSVEYRLFRK